MRVDFNKFETSLPYASELYGIYQPLLGWRSRRMLSRFAPSATALQRDMATLLVSTMRPAFTQDPQLSSLEPGGFTIGLGLPEPRLRSVLPSSLDSAFARVVLDRLRQTGDESQVWDQLLSDDETAGLLREAENRVRSSPMAEDRSAISATLARESAVAGAIVALRRSGRIDVLHTLFAAGGDAADMQSIAALQSWLNPAGGGAPGEPTATLSPIGIVHLFRQYFFEFDTFLGTPVQHVWLSPGASVELVEISTRRTSMERSTESGFEATQQSEMTQTSQDELSDAVKEDNQNTSKFGVSVESTSNLKVASMFTTELAAKATYDSEQIRRTGTEQTHKQLRQQTTKLSSELKQSYKSTFKTVVETTDTSSKRYLLQNASSELLNYELRRKMRQVGVQVQDLGMQLCWQTYIDRAGDQLGLSKLIHIGQPPETNVQPAQLVPTPAPYQDDVGGDFIGPDEDGYDQGLSPIRLFPKHGFEYAGYSDIRWPNGNHADELVIEQDPADPRVLNLHVRGGTDDEYPIIAFRFTVHFEPTSAYLAEIRTENDSRVQQVEMEKERLAKEAFFKAAADRVKAASNIRARPFAELREEERVIVYRGLIRALFTGVGLSTSNARAHHLAAELVQSMFDVDRMLYFVAPEWWAPRPLTPIPHTSPQDTGLGTSKAQFDQIDTTMWGGATSRPDNYYISEDSTSARLGSSLGWILQLDGDNLRNAFLNAPWVKAVIPIRPDREIAALDWLTSAAVEGSYGLSDLYEEAVPGERDRMLATLKNHSWDDAALNSRYQAIASTDVTLHDAILYLVVVVEAEHEKSRTKVSDTLPDSTPVNYLPADKVFERGFDPLLGGFDAAGPSFAVFDQWIEVLPTDQIVAVEVTYDPKTGMQK